MYYNDNTTVFLNGKWLKASDANTNLYSQTLHYGNGVFEGIRSYKTEFGVGIFKGIEHFERLLASAKTLDFEVPYTANQLLNITLELLEKNNLENAYIRPLIYMGANMHLTNTVDINVLVCAWEWGPYFEQDTIKVCTNDQWQPDSHFFPHEVKIVGQFSNAILATSDAKKKGFDDALLLTSKGLVACGPSNNVFIEKGGVIYTPSEKYCFNGITRKAVIELAKELEFEVVVADLTLDIVKNADAAFYTGTASGVVGIGQIDDTIFPEPWEDTNSAIIQAAYKHLVTKREHTSTKVA